MKDFVTVQLDGPERTGLTERLNQCQLVKGMLDMNKRPRWTQSLVW